ERHRTLAVLDAREALFLRGREHLAVAHDARGAVVECGVDAERVQERLPRLSMPRASGRRAAASGVPRMAVARRGILEPRRGNILPVMTRKLLLVGKALVWAGALVPLVWLVARGFEVAGWTLGANPVETVLHTLGKTSLNLLLLTLAVTPVRRITGWNWLIRF